MAQTINTNVLSLNAQRNLNNTQNALQTSFERLSSGLRINSAKDDAAGLAIAERFTTQIRGLNQAVRNANDGISFSQTAEGALSTASNAMQRIRELAVQSANDTNSSTDREAINNEVQQLIAEVNRIASSTQFNGKNVLDGSSDSLVFQVGANQNQTIGVTGVDSRGSQLGARISESGSINATNLAAAITANDLAIAGTGISLTGATSISDVVSAINAETATTGVQARLASTVTSAALTFAAPAAATDITINGAQINIAAGATAATAIEAINSATSQTGVTATDSGGAIVLSSAGGADIELVDGGTIIGGNQTFNAGIVLASNVRDTDFLVAGTFAVETGGNALGATQANQTLNGVSVLDRQSATSALATLDFAVQRVNSLRAELGAVQTRFESTISNLQVTSENLSAARSRIQDADFAAETAALTRNQILQQAGISIVAQANAAPQSVLSLLQ